MLRRIHAPPASTIREARGISRSEPTAAKVVTTRGNGTSLQCGYPGWAYGLDGTLQAAREMEGTEDFDEADFCLVPIRVDTLGPFVCANLDSRAAPLAGWIGAIPSEIA